jgi:uncharacterized protein YybS (DUF2232 family)
MDEARSKPIYDFLRFLAITLGCLIGGLYLPLVGIILIIFLPTPPLLLIFRQGWNMGLFLIGIIITFLSFLYSPWYGIIYFVLFGGSALILAYCFDIGYTKEKTLAAGFIVNSLILICFIVIFTLFSGSSLEELLSKQIDYNISESIRVYEAMKLGKEQIAVLRQSAGLFKTFFINAYAGLYGAFTTLVILFNFLFSRKILSRLGIIVPDSSPYTELSFPDKWVWGAIAGGLLWAFGDKTWNILGINLSIIFITVYGIQGFSILFFFINKSHLSRLAKWILLFLFIVQPLLIIVVSGVGVFDTWFDFRKIKQKNFLNKLTI